MEDIFFKKVRSFVLLSIFALVGCQLFAVKKTMPVITAENKTGKLSIKNIPEINIDKVFEDAMAAIELDDQDQVSNRVAKLQALKEKLVERKRKELEKRHPAPNTVGKTAWQSIKGGVTDTAKFLAGEPLKYAVIAAIIIVPLCKVTGYSFKDVFKLVFGAKTKPTTTSTGNFFGSDAKTKPTSNENRNQLVIVNNQPASGTGNISGSSVINNKPVSGQGKKATSYFSWETGYHTNPFDKTPGLTAEERLLSFIGPTINGAIWVKNKIRDILLKKK
ncbi:MAG: hypothetical protein ABH827_05535 [bacterium]